MYKPESLKISARELRTFNNVLSLVLSLDRNTFIDYIDNNEPITIDKELTGFSDITARKIRHNFRNHRNKEAYTGDNAIYCFYWTATPEGADFWSGFAMGLKSLNR